MRPRTINGVRLRAAGDGCVMQRGSDGFAFTLGQAAQLHEWIGDLLREASGPRTCVSGGCRRVVSDAAPNGKPYKCCSTCRARMRRNYRRKR